MVTVAESFPDVLAGLLTMVSVTAAALGWLLAPLIPLLFLLLVYVAARFGVRTAVRMEHRMVDTCRRAARGAASWVLDHVGEPSPRNPA